MTEFHIVLMSRLTDALPQLPGEELSSYVHPLGMTNGFRKVFTQVFSDVRRWSPGSAQVSWLGQPITIREAWLLRSDASRLSALEGDNLVVVLRATSEVDRDRVSEEIRSQEELRGMREEVYFAELQEQLSETRYAGLLEVMNSQKPSAYVAFDEYADDIAETVPLLMGFYYFGLILVHRIDRAQSELELTAVGSTSQSTFSRIAQVRVRLTNVARYFLTTNRSNHALAKQFALDLPQRMKLTDRYARQLTIHESLERHLDNVLQMRQSRSAQRTNTLVILLTALTVPVGLFSALVAFQLKADFVSGPQTVVKTGGFWLVWMVSLSITMAVIGVASLVASFAERRSHGR